MLHSVQHLFLSTESPSLPCGHRQTKKVREPTRNGHRERRAGARNPGCCAKSRAAKGFPSSPLPALICQPSHTDATLMHFLKTPQNIQGDKAGGQNPLQVGEANELSEITQVPPADPTQTGHLAHH